MLTTVPFIVGAACVAESVIVTLVAAAKISRINGKLEFGATRMAQLHRRLREQSAELEILRQKQAARSADVSKGNRARSAAFRAKRDAVTNELAGAQ